MVKFKRNVLSAALASAILMQAQFVLAQESSDPATVAATEDAAEAARKRRAKQEPAELEAIEVTGIRAGIESAIWRSRRTPTSIVEAVSAEDIGKLPDSQHRRIDRAPAGPGRAARRRPRPGHQRARPVARLRHHPAQRPRDGQHRRQPQRRVRPVPVRADERRHRVQDPGRQASWARACRARSTCRPCARSTTTRAWSWSTRAASTTRSGSAANADAIGNRLNASYVGQSVDRRFGFAIGFSHADTPIQEDQVGCTNPGAPSATTGARRGRRHLLLRRHQGLRRTGDHKRDGVMATLEFRPKTGPAPSTCSTTPRRAGPTPPTSSRSTSATTTAATAGSTSPARRSTATAPSSAARPDNLYPLVRGMYNKREDEIRAFGWNNEFNLGRPSWWRTSAGRKPSATN
jgi:iron complex outermembrane receptor protein